MGKDRAFEVLGTFSSGNLSMICLQCIVVMTKVKQLTLLSFLALALSACAKSQPAPLPMTPVPTAYYTQQITPMAGVVQPINTKRYSDMHITQSSYLFK